MSNKVVRVVRLLEYTYDSVETFEIDQAHWQVQRIFRPNRTTVIRSSVLPIELIELPAIPGE